MNQRVEPITGPTISVFEGDPLSAEPQPPSTAGSPEHPVGTGAPAPLLPIAVPPAPTGHQPPAQPVLGAERSPGVVALLSIVTLGLYLIYWWYTVNREMRDFARTAQPTHPLASASPGTSTLAVTLGAFIIVPVWVTAHSTARRVGEAMSLSCRRMTGPTRRCTCSCSRSGDC
jgi:hypothetical protein